MSRLKDYAFDRAEEIVELLRELVERESPTSSKPANDAIGDFVGEQLTDVGLDVERHRRDASGDHLVARWGGGGSGDGAAPTLVLCHMDTVWPLGTVLERPFRRSPRALHGPGVFDMKGGLACTLFALRALRSLGLAPRRPVTLLFNTDEEIGSPTSRALVEDEAARSARCLVMEAGEGMRGNLKTRRKGIGSFRVRITGQAAPDIGTTINVGVVEGGIARNVVAPWAEAQVDVRAATLEEAARVADAIASLAPVLEGATVEVSGGLTRPPMAPTEDTMSLYHRVQAIAASELDMELSDGMTGGGSDGQYAAAVGCPTLDGLGVIGAGAHSAREFTLTRSLPERTALLATLLLRL